MTRELEREAPWRGRLRYFWDLGGCVSPSSSCGHLGFELAGVVDQKAGGHGSKSPFRNHSLDQRCLGWFKATLSCTDARRFFFSAIASS